MQFELKKMTAACAAALAVAGCGGGGGGGGETAGGGTATRALTLSGTAATGLALSGGAVVVKCSSGTGTATTGTDGTYSITITDGALPCMIEVTGTVDGTEVKLHSVTEAGTASGANVAAVANVTPLTELIVAKLAAAIPSDLFASFGSGTQISSADLTAATTAVVSALKEATGIDLGTIDPFKTTLVAATASAPASGNDYDKALDALKEKVSVETLPQVVAQVATSTTTTTDSDATTLKDVMSGVSSGALEGCPYALSGKYRTIDYFGRTRVAYLDFNKDNPGWFTPDKATRIFPITKSSTEACRFTAAGLNTANEDVTYDIVIGRSGVGAYTVRNATKSTATVGFIFPVQAHALSTVEGNWNFAQSGVMALDNTPGEFSHFYGRLGLSASGSVAVCEYGADGSCTPDLEAPPSIVTRTDGGFNLTDGSFAAPIYAYKAPNGSVALFGTTNPDGLTDASAERTVIVASRVQTLSLPAVSTTESKYWDLTQVRRQQTPGTPPTINVTEPIGSDGTTVIETLSATSFKRKRTSDGREDVITINSPVAGWRSRAPATGISGMNQLMVAGMGLSVATNTQPTSPTNGYLGHFYVVSVSRP